MTKFGQSAGCAADRHPCQGEYWYESATGVGCISGSHIYAKPHRLCLWAAMHRLRYQDSRLTQTVRSGQGRNFASSHGEPEAGTHPTHNWDFRGFDGVKISLFGPPWQGWLL